MEMDATERYRGTIFGVIQRETFLPTQYTASAKILLLKCSGFSSVFLAIVKKCNIPPGGIQIPSPDINQSDAFPLTGKLSHTEVLHQDHRFALHFVTGLDEASPQCAEQTLPRGGML
jgi:hypothetical protein